MQAVFCLVVLLLTVSLVAARQRDTSGVEARRDTAMQIAATGGPAAARLVPMLDDPAEIVRVTVAAALGRLRAREAVPPLVARWQAERKQPLVRRTIAWALADIGDAAAVPDLTKWLSSEKEREVRAAIVSALGACGTAAATAPLVTALGDKDAFVRRQAARGLGRLRALDAVGPLTTSLGGDVDADVRREAAAALGSIRSASARPALQKALRDPDPYVTEEAARALTLIGG